MMEFDKWSVSDGSAPYACLPEQSRGRVHSEVNAMERSVYQRDRDRILHSGAFRKLKYKTQVFVYHEGDYYRTRLTHSLEVAQISRSLSRSLGLNEDLAEALALVHDFGHTPFGHAGEEALDIMMQPYGGFNHNDQTLRIITLLEQRYAEFDGLNLTWETLEGISKHNGPIFRDYSATIQELNRCFDLQLGLYGSLESQIASLADDVAYNAHDLNDGLRAGFFSINDLLDIPLVSSTIKFLYEKYPSISDSRLIHELTRRTVNVMVDDILKETRSRLGKENPSSCQDVREKKQPMAAFSSVLRTQVAQLRSFLFQRMYRHYKVNRMANKAKSVITSLFELFMSEPSCLPSEWQHDSSHIKNASQARTVADYIAGMTDRYALLEHERLFDLKAKV